VPDSVDEFARTDLLLDALAQRRHVDVEDPDADVLTTLLEDWRDNLRWPPASALVTPEEAVDALRTGLAERRRGHRGLAVVGSVAVALLVLSGFGAMVVEARPGATLYGLHAMFFVVTPDAAALTRLAELVDEGRLRPIVSQEFPLRDGRRAFESATLPHPPGKTVLIVR